LGARIGVGVSPGQAGVTRGPGTTNYYGGSGPAGQQQTPYQPGQSPDDPTKATYEKIYAPERMETEQYKTQARGQRGSRGRMKAGPAVQSTPSPATSYAPYYDVLSDYQQAAEEALAQEKIPLAHKQRVKAYFEELKK
jgi:hypothetical protein